MAKNVLGAEVQAGKPKFWKRVYRQRYLFLMSLPFVVWLIIFAYIPLLGWSYAFVDFIPGKSVFECEFVGLKYFAEMFTDPMFFNAFKNTIIMSVLGLVFGSFLCPLFFAVLLHETRSIKLKKSVQTVSYLPHFVSWVVVSGIVLQMLSPEGGMVNNILMALHIIDEPVNIIGMPEHFYLIITVANIWKELGWSAIIYISAMSGIDTELYEAAAVDGAGRFRRIWSITLPGIRNTIIILLIMNIGSLINSGFEAQMLLTNALNERVTEVLGLYILNYGIGMQRFSFGTAAGIFTSLCSCFLVLIANAISKRTTEQALF